MSAATPDHPLAELKIQNTSAKETIPVTAGKQIFILGRNGTGKSALVHKLRADIGDKVVYLPASRPSYFDNESLSLTPASRRQLTDNLKVWDTSSNTRWKPMSGTSRNEKAIHDLQAVETQYKINAANEIKREGGSSVAVARLQSNCSPLDRVNAILSQANLPIQMLIDGGELRATQQGNIYSYAKMSDGERAALIFAGEVVAAAAGSVFLIDEPELHLHPSIVVPLLNALFSERHDCGFVVCTHELDLAGGASSAQVILVRSCTWQSDGNSVSAWDVDILPDSSQIPDWLRIDLMGARRKILFIEGTSASLDQPLYALLFPTVSVRTRETCRDVMRAVEGLRAVAGIHHAEAFGIVDFDGMSDKKVAELEAKSVYSLPIFSVESLYYSPEVLSAVASRQAGTLGEKCDELLAASKEKALAAMKTGNVAEHLASRIAEQQMRDQLMMTLPSRETMRSEQGESINVSVQTPYPTELARIKNLISTENMDGIVSRYPVRESGLLDGLAKGLHFATRGDYEKAALTRIGADKDLQVALKAKFKNLAALLE